jgi:hypothetical protein
MTFDLEVKLPVMMGISRGACVFWKRWEKCSSSLRLLLELTFRIKRMHTVAEEAMILALFGIKLIKLGRMASAKWSNFDWRFEER